MHTSRRSSGTKNDARRERDAIESDVARYSAEISPTNTRCAAPGCGLPQWFCPSGVTCDAEHGGEDLGEVIDASKDMLTFDEWRRMDERATEAAGRLPEIARGEQMPAASRPRSEHRSIEQKLAELSAGPLDRIVEQIFVIDPEGEFERLSGALKIGTETTPAHAVSTATLTNAADAAEDNARAAHALYATAELERETFEIDARVIMSDMRRTAVASLELNKKRGDKTITVKDIESEIARVFPDAYRDLAVRRKKVELAAEHMKRLADLAKERIKTTNTLLQTKR